MTEDQVQQLLQVALVQLDEHLQSRRSDTIMLNGESVELPIMSVTSYKDADVLTEDAGFVIRFYSRGQIVHMSEFQITVVQS